MTRKHFNTLFIPGACFTLSAPAATPTGHNAATFRLRVKPCAACDGESCEPCSCLPSVLSLDLWTGFGNGEKHAGSATPSTDPREMVPACDPLRSGRATRDGWQPVAIVDRDALTFAFVTRSVNDSAFVGHIAAECSARGYTLQGFDYVCTIFGARMEPTTLSRTGVPHNRATFRNTDANEATHRDRARRNGNALMEFGRRQQGG